MPSDYLAMNCFYRLQNALGRYWADLVENESQRKRFGVLSGAGTNRTTYALAAISRALTDVCQYEFDAARLTLIPPKKKRVLTTQEGTTIEKWGLRDLPEKD